MYDFVLDAFLVYAVVECGTLLDTLLTTPTLLRHSRGIKGHPSERVGVRGINLLCLKGNAAIADRGSRGKPHNLPLRRMVG